MILMKLLVVCVPVCSLTRRSHRVRVSGKIVSLSHHCDLPGPDARGGNRLGNRAVPLMPGPGRPRAHRLQVRTQASRLSLAASDSDCDSGSLSRVSQAESESDSRSTRAPRAGRGRAGSAAPFRALAASEHGHNRQARGAGPMAEHAGRNRLRPGL
jgi:hypothetical protein